MWHLLGSTAWLSQKVQFSSMSHMMHVTVDLPGTHFFVSQQLMHNIKSNAS